MNKGPDAEERFKEIAAAYEVLSDAEKRSVYDRFGEEGLRGEFDATSAGPQGVDPFEVFSEYFGEYNNFFGGSGEQAGFNFNFRENSSLNLDIRCDLYLSFEESIFGGKRDVEVPYLQTCDDCGGTGAKSSSDIKTCSECGGRGRTLKTEKTPFGVMSQVETVEGMKDLRIPPGTQPRHQIRLPSMGVPNVRNPSARGDHYFIVDVKIPKHISDAERELVEKLASLRKTKDELQGNKRDVKSQTSNDRSKSEMHWWESIKDVLRRKQPGERFASICVDTSVPVMHTNTLLKLPCMTATCVILLSAVITFLMSKSWRSKLLQRRKHIAHGWIHKQG